MINKRIAELNESAFWTEAEEAEMQMLMSASSIYDPAWAVETFAKRWSHRAECYGHWHPHYAHLAHREC